ncbi:hypothetical protein CDAR_87701 [Caerostris darwini]|uniref:Uncharacterized protein n=1 Tax=Caerostris darwini TaxID=1538125 RepID=A0AAV4S376_9ARAC|nr:hypothetical protein CDAR_87701 [Caerostris darwini]
MSSHSAEPCIDKLKIDRGTDVTLILKVVDALQICHAGKLSQLNDGDTIAWQTACSPLPLFANPELPVYGIEAQIESVISLRDDIYICIMRSRSSRAEQEIQKIAEVCRRV